ncbi:uncharacterized protein LOC127358311 [Dicentrarchus labrax]|uniref:uncharacterized protein LOC127358311 n=1 Tax=Dicentrarchus labrax TaxID=13489 RepID=UPI0021F5223E|nr:uncharacterized protein LOC127358311 [Dicentrarchus labrax]
MNPANPKDVDLAVPMATAETIRPLVHMSLDRQTSSQRAELQSFKRETESIISKERSLKKAQLTPVLLFRVDEEDEEEDEDKDKDKDKLMKITEAVSTILIRQAAEINLILECKINTYDCKIKLSEEEEELLISSTSKDAEEAALDIARTILEEISINTPPEPEDESLWIKVGNQLKAFLVNLFTKAAFLRFISKLRRRFLCFMATSEMASLEELVKDMEQVVKNMHPPEEDDECLYEKIMTNFSSGRKKMAEELSQMMIHHLKHGHRLNIRMEVQNEVDSFLKLTWDWLVVQIRQHQRNRDRVTAALRKIKRVVETLPTPSETHLAPTSITDAPASITDTPTSITNASTSMTDAPASITDTPTSITDAPAAVEASAHPLPEWDELSCKLTVAVLVKQITKDHFIRPSNDGVKTLTDMLWSETETSGVTMKWTKDHIKKTVKAVHKDLCKKMGGAGIVRLGLLSQDTLIYNMIIETLKKHLLGPQKKSGVKKFFKGLFKTMAKPFTAQSKCDSKD